MRIPFFDESFAPVDRQFTHVFRKKSYHYMTLGACSYVVEASNVEAENDAHVLIGRYCSIARDVSFLLGLNHNYKNVVTTYPFDVGFVMEKICAGANITKIDYFPEERRGDNHHQIIVGNDVWIGAGATIIGGVKIGSGAIIGTNAMVTKDVPPYAIAAGNPARIVKYRFDAETIQKFMAVKWWNWSVKKVYKNLPLIYDTEKFLAKHFPPVEIISDENFSADLRAKLQDGWKVYQLVADFRAAQPLWKEVVEEFCRSNSERALLAVHGREKDLAAVEENPRVIKIPVSGRQKFLPQVLKTATHLITTREMVTLECLDWLYGADVKIISALDEGIFE
ncbi:MAG: CatB-related O-acetyltransferase [Selenomonadaceae bacterium]|nr:CatB-related O-acetyltransferase [Selenomonadaceae bacterium]